MEWVTTPYSRRSSQPGIEPASLMSPALAGRLFTASSIWEALSFELQVLHLKGDNQRVPCQANASDVALSLQRWHRFNPWL